MGGRFKRFSRGKITAAAIGVSLLTLAFVAYFAVSTSVIKEYMPARPSGDYSKLFGNAQWDLLGLLGSGLNGTLAMDLIHWPKSLEPAGPVESASVTGYVRYEGVLPKPKKLDMSKEPNCAKQYKTPPLTENVVGGPNNALSNVVVYISAGLPEEAPTGHVSLAQYGCRYFPHVLALQARQEIWVRNDDDVSHTVHLMTKYNPELNRLQSPAGPEVVITNDKPEFIKVRCELHPWMRGVIAVLKNSHFAVTDGNGSFSLPDLPPGKYTVTVWHESFGSESQQIVVGRAETKNISFVLKVKND